MILETLLHTIQQYKLITPQRWVIVAVSGGADSVALLHLLVSLRDQMDFFLHCATLDHGLRSETGKADAQWVARLCETLDVPVTVGYADTQTIMSQHQLGLETAARKARYDFLATVAQTIGADAIMTAHHADDQAETILMHILRGTSLEGIRGMGYRSPMPDHPEYDLLRPLLDVSRKQIESYCREYHLTYLMDETNADTDFMRNRIRHEILPQLKSVNPQIMSSLNRLGKIATLEMTYIQTMFDQIVIPHVHQHERGLEVKRSIFTRWHPALQNRCVRYCVAMLTAEPLPEFDHILSATQLALKGKVGAVAVFPNGIRLRLSYDSLMFEHHDNPIIENPSWRMPSDLELPVVIPGRTTVSNENWALEIAHHTDGTHLMRLYLPLQCKAILRTRRPGDRIRIKGLGGKTQKLKQWFIDRKIPQHQRDIIPLLVINGEIAVVIYDNGCYITEYFTVLGSNFVEFFLFAISEINDSHDKT